jgi:hypothetical protein
MDTQQALYAFVKKMIDLIFSLGGAGSIVAPLFMIYWVLRFLRWSNSLSQGGADFETMTDQAEEYKDKMKEAPRRIRGSIRRRF